MLDGRIDQDDGHPALVQAGEMRMRGVGLGVRAAGEHHARDLLLEQHPDVLGLGESTRRAGAQHGGEAALREAAADDLGKCGKDRVLQLGKDQPHEARAVTAQQRRPLVTEDVERRQDRVAGRRRHTRLAVQHPADGRLAYADLLRYIC